MYMPAQKHIFAFTHAVSKTPPQAQQDPNISGFPQCRCHLDIHPQTEGDNETVNASSALISAWFKVSWLKRAKGGAAGGKEEEEEEEAEAERYS